MRLALGLALLIFSTSCFGAISAKSYVVLNQSGEVILEKNSEEVRPIASITKILVLGTNKETWGSSYSILNEDKDFLKGTRLRLKLNSQYFGNDLLSFSLISSYNEAIKSLVRTEGQERIIEVTNKHFAGSNTKIVEPSGLSPENKSTAKDLAKFALEIRESTVAKISSQPFYKSSGITYRSTNSLIGTQGWNFKLSKTGYINEAGGCILAVITTHGQDYSIAILGSDSVRSRLRDLVELRKLFDSTSYYQLPITKSAKVNKRSRKK